MSSGSPYYSLANHTPDAQSPRKEICNYFSPSPIYSLAWSRRKDRGLGFRMALGSFNEASSNTLQVIQLSPHHDAQHTPELADFGTVCETPVDYPLTKVQWKPSGPGDLVAGSGDALRLWEVESTGELGELGVVRGRLVSRAQMSTRADYSAPLTSFDWCAADPRLIIASSIDTTCTLWDVETQQARTQLIAHDREVFDVGFVANSANVFASAGADGSVRMFDLRALEHSTILYEAPPDTAPAAPSTGVQSGEVRLASFVPPLLRLSCNPLDPNYLATFALDSRTVNIIDVRHPGASVVQLVGHQAPVQAVQWSPVSSTQLCSAGADARVLVWDIQQVVAARQMNMRQAGVQAAQAKQLGRIAEGCDAGSGVQAAAQAAAAQAVAQSPSSVAPSLTYAARLAVNSLAWHHTSPEWISIGFGNTVQTLRL
ncbi:hypothetical protein LPJ73_001163 [Coemansia sp. RSA 2703]|nr:hypothetical protein LPJ73_001163 [Coemansia sp. RSA 2703]KAJ2364813.1 hypothetical protein IW150_006385 [Coemansia sp. RSA 2607]KAJ2384444.1 hypothetical protein GGI05_005005 [Coemansia sp. RSA 2603]